MACCKGILSFTKQLQEERKRSGMLPKNNVLLLLWRTERSSFISCKKKRLRCRTAWWFKAYRHGLEFVESSKLRHKQPGQSKKTYKAKKKNQNILGLIKANLLKLGIPIPPIPPSCWKNRSGPACVHICLQDPSRCESLSHPLHYFRQDASRACLTQRSPDHGGL